jgi:parvulin-like peptidyl-prolyl isomerase
MQLRPLLLGVLVLVAAALLFGCGKESTPTATTPETSTSSPETATTTPQTEPATTAPAAVETDSSSITPTELREIVAVINDDVIDQSMLDSETLSVISQYKSLYSQFGMDFQSMLEGADGRIMELTVESEALERLFMKSIVNAAIAKRNLTVSDEDVTAEFDRQYASFLETNGITEDFLGSYLQSQGQTLESFKSDARESIRQQLLMKDLQKDVAGPITLTDDELQAYWQDNQSNYATEEQIRASHILVATEAEAQDILDQLNNGADFATLAQEKSLDTTSGAKGGDLGWFGRGTMVSEFEDAAFALEVGQLSGIVQTQYGYHIILLTDRKPATNPTFDEVKDQVRADLEQEKITQLASDWYDAQLAASDIRINDPLLYAMRKEHEDLAAGIAAFEQVKDQGLSDDQYLSYIIGSLYEQQLSALQTQKSDLESQDGDHAAEIAALDTQIADVRAKALAAYEDALAILGEDADVQAGVQRLQSQSQTSSATE